MLQEVKVKPVVQIYVERCNTDIDAEGPVQFAEEQLAGEIKVDPGEQRDVRDIIDDK